MRLADLMTEGVKTIGPERRADEALAEMRRRRIHHLVVTDGDEVLGVVSERDLGGHAAAEVLGARQVRDLMTISPLTASPETTLRDAANLLRGWGIGCLPVVDRGKLIGIVTLSDLLDVVGRGEVGRRERPRPAIFQHSHRR